MSDMYRVLTCVNGSLPDGTNVQGLPVYALDGSTILSVSDGTSSRTDLPLGPEKHCFIIRNVLGPSEAEALIKLSEQMGYSAAAPSITTSPGIRSNQALRWLDHGHLTSAIFDRICGLLPACIDGKPLVGLSHGLYHFKYSDGDEFLKHVDGAWPGSRISNDGKAIAYVAGTRSVLSMLVYLNDETDGLQGGGTRLWDDKLSEKPAVEVNPSKGSALFFRHGSDPFSVWHEGAPVFGLVPKYVVRINVLYGED